MKNWLIRTSSNQIFGPVSKDKIIELIQNKTISFEDELCAGNGYWFFLREKKLVDRYVYGEEGQRFNPISEAKDVLVVADDTTQSASATEPKEERDHTTLFNLDKVKLELDNNEESLVPTEDESDDLTQIQLPDEDELDYPDPDSTKEKIDLSEIGLEIDSMKSEGRRISDPPPLQSKETKEKNKSKPSNESGALFPDNDDLEYPEVDRKKSDEC